jgi:hypothetical protein
MVVALIAGASTSPPYLLRQQWVPPPYLRRTSCMEGISFLRTKYEGTPGYSQSGMILTAAGISVSLQHTYCSLTAL